MKHKFSYKSFEDKLNIDDINDTSVAYGRRRKKFSYKDFIDGITASLPRYRNVAPVTVNMVWKEAVKYIIRELQYNREVYIPYIGYLSIIEQSDDIELSSDKKVKAKSFDYVEFKPFKIFLDILNLIDGHNEAKLNKVLDRTHINEVNFIQQDYDEYAEEYVEPTYGDSELEFTKAVMKGTKNENDILAKLNNGTYSMEFSPSARRRKALESNKKQLQRAREIKKQREEENNGKSKI